MYIRRRRPRAKSNLRGERLNHHKQVRGWKHPDSHVCRIGNAINDYRLLLAARGLGDSIFFLQAAVGIKPDKASQVKAQREIVILPMGSQQEVVKLSSEQHKQFDPGGWWGDAPHGKQRLYYYLFAGGGKVFWTFVCFLIVCHFSILRGKRRR